MKVYFMQVLETLSFDVEKMRSKVSHIRWEKAMSYVNRKDQNLSLLAYLLWKYASQEKETTWKLGKLNKPYIEGKVRFNIAHTQGMVACALSHQGEVGVDVEKIEPRNYLKKLDFIMSTEEIEQIGKNSKFFFQLWTLKEAFLKWKGTGIIDNLAQISFSEHIKNGMANLEEYKKLQGVYQDGEFISIEKHDYYISAFHDNNKELVDVKEIEELDLLSWISGKSTVL